MSTQPTGGFDSLIKELIKFLELIKKYKYYVLLIIGCFLVGSVFLLIRRSWLVVHWVPGYTRSDVVKVGARKHIVHRKKIELCYWKDEKLKKNIDTCIWREDNSENIKLVVGNWLSFLYEERVVRKRVGIQSVAFSASGQELFLSFDHSLFTRDWSIHRKWQLLDGMCRTVSGLGFEIQSILLLVNHETMNDDHFDFSQPWVVR